MVYLLSHIRKSPHRNCLEKHLKAVLPELEGAVLDIGSGSRRYDYLLRTKPEAIDIVPDGTKEIKFGDVNNLNYPNNSFDNILCLEVFEYLKTPEKAASEIYRVLKPGGKLVLSSPFMYKVHGDQIRLTEDYLKRLFESFSKTEVLTIGNFYTIILDILRGKIAKVKFKPLKHLFYLPYLFLVLFISLSRLSKDRSYISGYFVICEK